MHILLVTLVKFCDTTLGIRDSFWTHRRKMYEQKDTEVEVAI